MGGIFNSMLSRRRECRWDAQASALTLVDTSKIQPQKETDCLIGIAEILGSNDYEPLRCIVTRAPPRRFYRTFWRSIARRILQTKLSKSKQ